jgi:hypothetical protein
MRTGLSLRRGRPVLYQNPFPNPLEISVLHERTAGRVVETGSPLALAYAVAPEAGSLPAAAAAVRRKL